MWYKLDVLRSNTLTLRESGLVRIVHNTKSNLKLAANTAPSLDRNEINVLGRFLPTDGVSFLEMLKCGSSSKTATCGFLFPDWGRLSDN